MSTESLTPLNGRKKFLMTMQTMVDEVEEGGRRLFLESTPEIDKLIAKLGGLGVATIHWLFLDTEIGDDIILRDMTLARGASPSPRQRRQIDRVGGSLAAGLFEQLQEAIRESEFGSSEWLSCVTVRPKPGRGVFRISTSTNGLVTDVGGRFWDIESETP